MNNKCERPISEDALFQSNLADFLATTSQRCDQSRILGVMEELATLADQSNNPEERKRLLEIRHAIGHRLGIEPPTMDLRRIAPIKAGRNRMPPIRMESDDNKTNTEAIPKKASIRH